jgi:hypothetical protein
MQGSKIFNIQYYTHYFDIFFSFSFTSMLSFMFFKCAIKSVYGVAIFFVVRNTFYVVRFWIYPIT